MITNLTTSGSAYIKIDTLSNELIEYATNNFELLFNLHPKQRGRIIMRDRKTSEASEVESSRWHKSYLNTPTYDADRHVSSYMYCGLQKYEYTPLPIEFQPFIEKFDTNQVTINWYENGSDYIAPHSDCIKDLEKGTDIVIISLNEDDRIFRIKSKVTTNDSICKNLDIVTTNGMIISMCGDMQNKFRHTVPKKENAKRRISITCRKIKN